MLEKLYTPILLCLSIALLCSGCTFTKDPQSYMRPPQLPEDKESLKQVIQQALPAGASLIHPKKSNDLGSIYLKDLNHDGSPEAIAFYQTPDKEVRIRGMLWRMSGGTWKLVSDFQGEGYELDTLLFEDVTGDGTTEIIAGYSSGARLNKGLVIYRYDQEKLTQLYEAPYSEMVIDDINQDGKKDITLVTLDRNSASQAVTLQFDQKFQTIGTLALDPYINGYESMKAGWIAESKRGIILDAGVGAHASTTQILLFNENGLSKVFSDNHSLIKPRSTLNGDLNHDGIMEIGIDYEPKGSDKESHATMPYITAYYRWNGHEGLADKPLYERYMDYSNSFYFEIPADWKDNFSVQRLSQEGNGSIRFTSLSTGHTLVEWKTTPVELWDSLATEWKEIGRTSKTVTSVHLTEDSRAYAGYFHPLSELEKQEDSHEQSTDSGR